MKLDIQLKMASVKVAVRVRPTNSREVNLGSKCIIEMEGKRTSIINLKMAYSSTDNEDLHGRERVKDFFFDYSYWSYDENSSHFTTQEQVYKDLGTGVVVAADEGYNACIFAYGQTGSGKTHTMMGQKSNEGLIPRICENLFYQIHEKEREGVSFRTEVSYLEIYNERVRDLLRASTAKGGQAHTLKVREHPKEGPYVQGLTKHLVSDYGAIEAIMKQGNDLRTTASTNMNDTSSRSHAIFTVSYTQAKFMHNLPSETTSKINLVDLAGSERADSTGATGIRLKEGANINKSLVTLGSVISSLAEASTNTKKKNLFIPYRDSVLTWLLKDSLGGNSKTIMIATISPSDCNYAETLSTLRYANRAKNIINKPTVNEDTNVKLIRDLRAEIDKLKSIIGHDVLSDAEKAAARKLYENEERIGKLTDKWKDRWNETQKIMQERELAFQHRLDAGIRMESELPHLVALEDDLLSTGILLYHLKEGKTFVGTENSKTKPDIVISGPSILDEHCVIENNDGYVVLDPFPEAACSVNGTSIRKRVRLQQGDVVILGKVSIFRFNHPKEAEELREKRKSVGPGFSNLSMSTKFRSESDLLKKMRNPERDKREEDLSRQLEEARLLLEKQKQEEERRMEETRNEFTRQIREESRRLQETRGELESQRRARLKEAQTPEQIKKHLEELERHYAEAEEKRVHREKELSESIQSKENLIGSQEEKLAQVQHQCEEVKTENDKSVEREVDLFIKQRSEETTKLNNEIRDIVDSERAKSESPVNIDDIHAVWVTETNKIVAQEKLCSTLNNELNGCVSSLERKSDIVEDERHNLEQRKEELKKSLNNAQVYLEEVYHGKAKALKKYEHDYKNRYEFVCWERDRALEKKNERKQLVEVELSSHEDKLVDAQSGLDETKAKYYTVVSEENKNLATERYKVDQRKKEAIKRSIEDQREFNDKVKQYRSLLQKGQDKINVKKVETESLRQELTDLMKIKGENAKLKIESLRVELNDKIEDIHELEKNHQVVKNEEEIVIQTMMKELESKKLQNENEADMSEKVMLELEKVSREKILLLQEDVDACEKTVLQYKSDIERDEENLKEIDKLYETDTAKLDTELLYVAYLIEKEFQNRDEAPELVTIQNSKSKLEDINKTYKSNIENIQKLTDSIWKPLIESREEAQLVLEDLVRTRGIAEVTLTELEEQFSQERKEEIDEIEILRERLADFEEERNISGGCSENEIYPAAGEQNSKNDDSFEEILTKEKQKIQDEMYQKIISMETAMQAEIDQLKKREMDLISCLQKDRECLVDEKQNLEQDKDANAERVEQLRMLLKEKDKQLLTIRDHAQSEVEELKIKLSYANKEIFVLQDKLQKYTSLTSLNLSHTGDEELSDHEVSQILIRVHQNNESDDDEDAEIARLRVSPPPTPINRFLQSVNIYKKNQIKVAIPKFILRGLGRDSYHVFEVKLSVGDDHWSVYRRYRRFRELHRQMLQEYPIISNLEFPSRRYFGNRVEKFVRIRRAQLEAYLTAFLAIMSNVSSCPIYAVAATPLTKQDLGLFHPFFKQGVYEYTKNETDFDNFSENE